LRLEESVTSIDSTIRLDFYCDTLYDELN